MTPSPADRAQLEATVIQEVERRVGDLRKELKELDALRERTVVLDMQGWAKANKRINLIKQESETDENGREIYVHYLARLS